MAIALVGTIGTVTQGAASAAVTPTRPQTPTANNLLVLWVGVTGIATLPAAITGWTIAKQQAGTSCSASVYYKTAAGSDAAPTVAAITSGTISARLGEYSGVVTTTPVSSTGGVAGTTSGIAATNAAVDATSGCLMVSACALLNSSARTNATWNEAYTNATATQVNNASTSIASHYGFSYGITTANSVADKDTFAFTTTQLTGAVVALASFKAIQPEDGPALELSSFGTLTPGPGSSDTISSVTVSINQYSSATATAPTYQLWNGTTAQIGATQTGAATTTTTNVDSFTFTGVTYAQIATLRLRVFPHGLPGSVTNVDAVSLQVIYVPAAGVNATGSGAITFAGSGTATFVPPPGAIHVQDTANVLIANTATLSSTFPANTTVGNVICVIADCNSAQGSGHLDVPSGAGVTTWTQVPVNTLSNISMWYGVVATSGSNTVTITPGTSGDYLGFCASEFSGVSTTLIDHQCHSATSTAPVAVGTLTPTAVGQLVFIGAATVNGIANSPYTAGAPFTNSGKISTSSLTIGDFGAADWLVATSTAALTPTYPYSNTGDAVGAGGFILGVAGGGVNATGTGAITFGASGTATVTVNPTGSGAITFGASGTATVQVAATGTGAIAFGATGTAKVGFNPTGTGSISFGGTGTSTVTVTPTGTGAITFGGAGAATVTVKPTGTGAITFAGSGTATVQVAATGTGAITFGASGTALFGVFATGAGAITFGGTGTATYFVPATGTGAITFGSTGTATVTVITTGTGAITFGASGTGKVTVNPTGTGAIAFGGTGTASYFIPATGTGAITFGGAATVTVTVPATGTGAIVFAGSGTAAYGNIVPTGGTGAISFGGSGAAQVTISTTGTGALTFASTGTAKVGFNPTGTGNITFASAGTATVTLIATGLGAMAFAGTGTAKLGFTTSGVGAILFGATGTAVLVGAAPTVVMPVLISVSYGRGRTS